MKTDKLNFNYTRFTNGYASVNVITSLSNCKHSYIENISSIFYMPTLEDRVKFIKEVLQNCNILVTFNVNKLEEADFFKKYFEVYEVAKIPIGYSGGNQYHVFIRNKDSNAHNIQYLRPLPKVKEVKSSIKKSTKK